jgi:hypothetical protein
MRFRERYMVRQLTVDFNRLLEGDLVRGNARRAVPGTVVAVEATLLVGDDDWGVAPAEVLEYDEGSGALVLKVLAELQTESSSAFSEST